ESGPRGRVDDPSAESLACLGAISPMHGGLPGAAPRAPHVYAHDGVEVVRCHVPDRGVADDPGVVDEYIELPAELDGVGDERRGVVVVGDVAVVGDCLSATLHDDANGVVGRRALALAASRRPQVVDHDSGTLAGELE